jgi:hypothetical protein
MSRPIAKQARVWLLILGAGLLGYAPATTAQQPGPIRVLTDQVLVPVWALDRHRYKALAFSEFLDLAADAENVPIQDLSIRDFQIFEDGHEQKIQRMKFEDPALSEVRDNFGRHYEFAGPGGGRWIFPDYPDSRYRLVAAWPTYVLSYVPPQAPEGSCHRVKVKLKNHPGAMVLSLAKYCRIPLAPSDPLQRDKFGEQMGPDLTAATNGKIQLSLASASLFGDSDDSNVRIIAEFSADTLRYQWLRCLPFSCLVETIGMLGGVYTKDGNLLKRFSDFDCCAAVMGWTGFVIQSQDAHIVDAPRGYLAQVSLPPGQYELRVVVSDGPEKNIGGFDRGSDFGRAELPLAVDARDPQHLALSDIVLTKRRRVARSAPEDSTAERYAPLISSGMEYIPTAETAFKTGDPFFFYFEVYEPLLPLHPSPTVQAHLRIVDAQTGKIAQDSGLMNVEANSSAQSRVIPVSGELHNASLPEGSYRLEIQITDSLGQSSPWHFASFTIQ